MQRIAFIIRLKPGADPVEYKRRHDEIWPEMLEALRASVAFVEGTPGAVEPFALIRAVIAKAEGGAP